MKSALVIISHYNAWPTDQLVALLDQTRSIPSGYPFRTLIVVNQALDRPLELPERHADAQILYRENTGYNIGAWDYGWRAAPPADFYLFLQEECKIVRRDWLGSSVRRLSGTSVGMIGESLAWPGQTWKRAEYFHRGHPFQGDPSEAPIDHIGGLKRFLAAKGIPLGERGEHLQSIILSTRRDVLEAIGGFMIGQTKGDAIACELAISLAVVARGMKVEQAGLLPFRYIYHPQWSLLDEGPYTLLTQLANRFVPIPLLPFVSGSLFNVRKCLTWKRHDRTPLEGVPVEHEAEPQETRTS